MQVRSDSKKAAMTLIEVLLVIAIMAILAGLAIPSADPGILEQLRSAAGIVTADLAYARSQAVTYGSEFRVSFATELGQYEIKHVGPNPALNDAVANPFDDGSGSSDGYVVVLADLPRLGPEVRLAAVATVDASGKTLQSVDDVTFGSLGETTRSRDTRIWLAVGNVPAAKTITIRINAVTGLATVEPPGAHELPEAASEPSPISVGAG